MNEARDKPVYYSDLIKDNQIKTWLDNNDYVYLNGDTGTGKTTFVFTRLIDCALTYTGKHIFLLSNRKLLTQQHREALKKYNIDTTYYELNGYSVFNRLSIMTYQAFHEIKIKKNDIELMLECDVINGNDYIFILDECHYFLSDHWNKTTERTLNTILQFSTATFFISATGNNVIDYVNRISEKKITERNTIPIPQDYSNITLKSIKDNTKNHNKILDMICNILDNTSDKVMFYLNNANKLNAIAQELKLKYDPNIIKLCYSANNRVYTSLPSEDKQAFTADKQMNCRCILTTKIIDNGIDIYDDALRHVIIDMTEPETIIQAIGRKRTKTPLTVYINEPNQISVKKWIDEKQYRATESKSQLNKYQYQTIVKDLQAFLNQGAAQTIYERLKHTSINLDADNKTNTLQTYLQHYSGSDKYIDKDYVKSLLSDIGRPARQIDKINLTLKQLQIPYIIIEKRERINGNKNAVNLWYVSEV